MLEMADDIGIERVGRNMNWFWINSNHGVTKSMLKMHLNRFVTSLKPIVREKIPMTSDKYSSNVKQVFKSHHLSSFSSKFVYDQTMDNSNSRIYTDEVSS